MQEVDRILFIKGYILSTLEVNLTICAILIYILLYLLTSPIAYCAFYCPLNLYKNFFSLG